jgi:tetratricopeptide (TPR) repeat protein
LVITETTADLVIQARQIHDAVVADPRRFAKNAEDLVRRARLARHPEALALALRAHAWAHRARLADVAAKRLLDEAARVARRHCLDRTLAEVLTSRAAINQELGRLAAAQRDLDDAASLAGPSADLSFQQAVLHQNIGRLQDAAAVYRTLLNSGTPTRIQVISANNLAMIEAQHARYGEALRLLDEGEPKAARLGPALVAMLLESRAWVTVQAGRLTEGVRLFDEAGRAHREAQLPLGEHFVEYADALMDLRLIPEALSAARSAAEEFHRGRVPLMGAEALLRVAQLALLAGDPAEAEEAATAAAGSFQRQGRGVWKARATLVTAEARLRAGKTDPTEMYAARRAARTLESLGTWPTAVHAYLVTGRLAAALGRHHDAVAALTRAGDLARRGPVLVRLRGRLAMALSGQLLGDGGAVLTHCRRGLTDLARHRTALSSVELRALASGHGAELGRLALEVVTRDGSPVRVLGWMERTRGAAMLAIERPDVTDIQDDLQGLRSIHAELEGLSAAATREAAPAGSLLAQQSALENRIRRATWHRSAGTVPAGGTASAGQLRAALGDRVLVEYGLLGGRLFAVVLEPRRARMVELGPMEPVLDQSRALFFALRRLTQPRPEAALAAARYSADVRLARLTELLLRPLGLPPQAELVVVPVGPLHGMPWPALHDAPVSLAPSATSWARSLHRPRPAGDRVVLVAGPGLPGATAEVQALHGLYPAATVSFPPGSTAEEAARLLHDAGLAHLACHGRLRADNPMFSSLLLSDGPLTVQELQTRGVAPHRLVLASCESGADVSYAGDEVLGFVSALLARGTGGVVASIAAIPDIEAASLMYALHQRLRKGDTLAVALHHARGSLARDEPRAFVNWCTFGAHGAA